LALAEATAGFDPSRAQPHMIKLVAYVIKLVGCWHKQPTVHLQNEQE